MHVCCKLSLPVVAESKRRNLSKSMQNAARREASAAGSVIALTHRGQALRPFGILMDLCMLVPCSDLIAVAMAKFGCQSIHGAAHASTHDAYAGIRSAVRGRALTQRSLGSGMCSAYVFASDNFLICC